MHQFGDPQPASPALGTSAPGWVRVLVGALSLAGLAVATYKKKRKKRKKKKKKLSEKKNKG
jgi:hypothetical protein